METKFNYTPKRRWLSDFGTIVISLAMIYLGVTATEGIRFFRLITIGYPWSMIILVALGLFLLLYITRKMIKNGKIRKAAIPIVFEGENLKFPVVVSGIVTEESFKLADVESTKYSDEQGELTVTLSGGKDHVFVADSFETKEEFARFAAIIADYIEADNAKNEVQSEEVA